MALFWALRQPLEGPEEGSILPHALFCVPLTPVTPGGQTCPPAHVALPSAEQLKETHHTCDMTSQWAFVRLLEFGVPRAFAVC